MPRMSQRRRNGCKFVAIVGLTFAALALALAQQPSSAQLSAIRSSCRSDFISHCSGVKPGGRDALECLLHNSAQLSAACGRAVSAILPKSDTAKSDTSKPDTGGSDTSPAVQTQPPASRQPTPVTVAQSASGTTPQSAQDQLAAVGKACTLDDASHCSWIKSDNPELLLCLKANAAQLSQACQSVVLGATVSTPVTATPVAAPTEVATPKEVTPPKETRRPSSKQASAVRAACRSDFISHCAGVQPGGSAAAQCLERNESRLSRACRIALAAATGGGAPKETADTGSSDTPPAAKAPNSQQQSAIRAACRSDFISHCSGVQPGGSAALQCLQRNQSELSQSCQTALAAVGGSGGSTETADTNAGAPAAAPGGGFAVRRLPLREELAIVRICAIDRNTLCGGMPVGGGRILMCLAQNASQLSPRCRSALAAARGG